MGFLVQKKIYIYMYIYVQCNIYSAGKLNFLSKIDVLISHVSWMEYQDLA